MKLTLSMLISVYQNFFKVASKYAGSLTRFRLLIMLDEKYNISKSIHRRGSRKKTVFKNFAVSFKSFKRLLSLFLAECHAEKPFL